MNSQTMKTLLMAAVLLSSTSGWARSTQFALEKFVTGWFQDFDQNAPVEDFLLRLDDKSLFMQFPEVSLHSHEDFRQWYSGILREFPVVSHEVHSVEVTELTEAEAHLTIKVTWRAERLTGEELEFHAVQHWQLSLAGSIPMIQSYIVEEDLETTGLATFAVESQSSGLTCTCRGGPGNYPYACAPIKKTCHGGPGNYPYDCSVCP